MAAATPSASWWTEIAPTTWPTTRPLALMKSKYLIDRRDWPAARVGKLIGELDGCGGPGGDDDGASPPMS